MSKEIESRSRELFHALHLGHNSSEVDTKRLRERLSTDFLRVSSDFFVGKRCLDVGCGTGLNATVKMLEMGADHVVAVDLDESCMQGEHFLKKYKGRYTFALGSVLELDAVVGGETFDFVHSNGVLHHTTDFSVAVSKFCNAVADGGMCYLETYGKGGLVRGVASYLRSIVETDSDFRRFLEQMNEENILDFFHYVKETMLLHDDRLLENVTDHQVTQLFDQSMILTIKDILLSPIYAEHSYEEVKQMLEINGLTEVTRLTRYPAMGNVRRILAPLYADPTNRWSEMLYGSGMVMCRAVRA